MKLHRLLRGIKEKKLFGRDDLNVSSISDDSRLVKKGGLFVAISGHTVDGHKFITGAIKKGARVVVGEKEPEKSWTKNITYIKVKCSRNALGIIASNWFGNPSKKIKVIGVTGTKGKTTTVHMIYHILNFMGKKAGFVSTITNPGLHVTTPGCIELHHNLKKIVDKGYKYAVIEVSSHGIHQGRIYGVDFYIGVLTNIKPEHLDYHKTIKNYKRVKMDFMNSTNIKVICPEITDIDIFPGKFNNLNAEVSVLVVEKLGIKRKDAIKALYSYELPKGRLEEIKTSKDFRVFIDFAHTPDSLEQVLNYLKTITKDKLIVVFGCAGERDTKKRPIMGEISVNISNVAIFTAEDPRSENVEEIITQIVFGAKKTKAISLGKYEYHDSKHNVYITIPERGEAIAFAIQKVAKKGDVVVICGKGHENSMAYKGVEYSWSDHEAVKIALEGGIKRIKRN